MCGHVGIAGKLEYRDEDTMKRLLIFDYFRGKDSTGFASLTEKGDARIRKIASHPVDLFDMKKFDKALSAFDSTAFLGHNRAATLGVVNSVNAHPFEAGDIVGAHNGTLTAASFRALEEAIGEETGTDSEAIIKAIDKFGIEKTVPMLEGAWALVWLKKSTQELFFLRNSERPFWLGYSEDFSKVFWASEWPIMQAALMTGKKDYKLHVEDETSAFFETKVDTLYTFDLEGLKQGWFKSRSDFEGETLKGKEVPKKVVNTYTSSGSPFRDEAYGTTSTSTTTSTTISPSKKMDIEATVSDPFDGLLSQDDFDKMSQYGCSYCGAEVDYYEPGNKVWKDRQIVMGPCCSGLKGKNELHVQGSLEKYLQDNTKLTSLVVVN